MPHAVLAEIAHAGIARPRGIVGIEPYPAPLEWRAVQMHGYRGRGLAWVADLVVPVFECFQ